MLLKLCLPWKRGIHRPTPETTLHSRRDGALSSGEHTDNTLRQESITLRGTNERTRGQATADERTHGDQNVPLSLKDALPGLQQSPRKTALANNRSASTSVIPDSIMTPDPDTQHRMAGTGLRVRHCTLYWPASAPTPAPPHVARELTSPAQVKHGGTPQAHRKNPSSPSREWDIS